MPNLVGTGNNQAPTNAMLGGLAYQDSVGEIDIEKIKARTGDTAVDIFVYDTSKDSDGGAWRHRTQNKSWYNEGVSQYRGARKEFPAVAVLVLEGNVFTIYDGDDPNLPMWMIFNKGSNTYFQVTTNACVAALNGKIVSGGNASNDRLRVIDFLLDNEVEFSHSAGRRTTLNPISDRNGSTKFGAYDASLPGIVNRYVNAVAMTVQPNAPIDSATGLPIPTIAVGTQGGISLIRDDGLVFDYGSFSPVTFVAIGKDAIVGAVDTSGIDYIFKTGLAQRDENYDAQILSGTGNYYMNSNSGTTPLLRDLNISAMTFNPSDTTVYRGGDNGFDIITETDTVSSSVSNPLIAYVDTDYNSGYMVGDIRSAFLSDTIVETMNEGSATNILTNGSDWTGASGTTAPNGWTSFGHAQSSFTIDSGRLKIGNGSANNATAMSQNITTVVGTTYTLYFNYEVHSSAQYAIIRAGNGVLNGSLGYFYGTSQSNVQSTMTFKATSTTTNISVQMQATSGNAYIWVDTMYVKAIGDINRSLKPDAAGSNGLSVHGVIEKHAVAEGAELVGYRPNSASVGDNYLRRPLKSAQFDLTGDWSIVFWARNNGNYAANYSGWEIAPDNISSNNAYSIIPLSMYFDNTGVMGLRGMNNAVNIDATGTPFSNVDAWRCVSVVQRSGRMHLYIDGKLDNSRAVTFTNPTTDYSLYIFGWSYSTTRYFGRRQIDFSLFRLSESALTEEQVQRIYNDEKQLFQKNAKCTISGATSAVTALGFDDSTNTAYVGTASGRSDFRGLNRINSTTTAVTTAISASNGLVAEQ